MARLHIIGAGISGLACAIRAATAGREIAVYEAAPQPGGRCRSFHDESIGRLVDNGSHLLMGANRATRTYLADIGAADSVGEIAPAQFPFRDLQSGESWCLRPTRGPIPRWLWRDDRRVLGTRPADYLRDVMRLARAGETATVRDCVDPLSPLYRRLWQPMTQAALNTNPAEASARLLWRVIADTFLKGEVACRPMVFPRGLSPTLIDPAVRLLGRLGGEVRLKARLKGMEWVAGKIVALHFPEGLLPVRADDAVVLAVPPESCAELWPDAKPPSASRAIVNLHFRVPAGTRLPDGGPFLGLIGANAQWLFLRDDILSVTVSAADALVERPSWQLANLFWDECARVLGRNIGRLPPWRVIKERRATFAQTPAQLARRAPTTTALANLFLAGDWTATGLPATIEGSVRSGFAAAQAALAAMDTARRQMEERA